MTVVQVRQFAIEESFNPRQKWIRCDKKYSRITFTIQDIAGVEIDGRQKDYSN